MSDQAYNGYKSYCQHKLLKTDSHALTSELSRTYPPCLLEWKANRSRANMALELISEDGAEVKVQLDSWTTGEDFAMTALKKRWDIESEDCAWSFGHKALFDYHYLNYSIFSTSFLKIRLPNAPKFFSLNDWKMYEKRYSELHRIGQKETCLPPLFFWLFSRCGLHIRPFT